MCAILCVVRQYHEVSRGGCMHRLRIGVVLTISVGLLLARGIFGA